MNKLKRTIKKILVRLLTPIFKEIESNESSLKLKTRKDYLLSSFQSCGYGVMLNGQNWTINNPNKLIVGNNVHFGNNLHLNCAGGLIIGENTHFSRNITIYTTNHDYEGIALPYDEKNIYKPVIIGKNVWVGMNVSIIPGIKIGDGAIIGMGTVVNRDVLPFEIVGSSTTKFLKKRNLKHYNHLLDNRFFGGVNGKLLNEIELHSFKKTYSDFKNNKILFVLSTGRSGSHFISKLLNEHKQIKSFHEDIHQLIRLSTQLAHHEIERNDAYFELESIFNNKSCIMSSDQVIVHSDQRLWNFIPFLKEYFPNCKFIHLIRNPEESVKSMVVRNWYKDNEYLEFNKHDWAMYRLQGNKTKTMTDKAWNNLTNVEKCVWYWNFVNYNIEKSLLDLPKSESMTIDLDNIENRITDIISFLSLEDTEIYAEKSNKMTSKHSKNLYLGLDKEISEALTTCTIKYK